MILFSFSFQSHKDFILDKLLTPPKKRCGVKRSLSKNLWLHYLSPWQEAGGNNKTELCVALSVSLNLWVLCLIHWSLSGWTQQKYSWIAEPQHNELELTTFIVLKTMQMELFLFLKGAKKNLDLSELIFACLDFGSGLFNSVCRILFAFCFCGLL